MTQPSAVALDPFTRQSVRMFDETSLIPVSKLFLSFFGDPSNGGQVVYEQDTTKINIDIIRGNKTIAQGVPRGDFSRNVGVNFRNTEISKFSNVERVFPLNEVMSEIHTDQLYHRLPGEPVSGGYSRRARAAWNSAKLFTLHAQKTFRLFEALAAQALMNGKHDIVHGEATAGEYDFYRNTDNNVNAVAYWTDSSNAKPLNDYDNAYNAVHGNGNTRIDFSFIGTESVAALLDTAQIKEYADNRRFGFFDARDETISYPARMQKFVDNGARFVGVLKTPTKVEIYLFTSDAEYDVFDDAGNKTSVRYLPADAVLVGSSTARCDAWYGPGEVLPMTSIERTWYREMFGVNMGLPNAPANLSGSPYMVQLDKQLMMDAYPSSDRRSVTLRTQSAGIFAPVMTDAFGRIDNTIAP